MRFFQTFTNKSRENLIQRQRAHQQWWETAAEFPATDDPHQKPDLAEFPASAFDPQGSYTGKPVDGSRPIQDADDL